MALSVFQLCLGSAPTEAIAQGGRDATCCAILSYMADQGLTQDSVIALGNSGLEPDPETPIIEPGNNGGNVIVEPPPVSNQGNQDNNQDNSTKTTTKTTTKGTK